jgi:hypothetical protein
MAFSRTLAPGLVIVSVVLLSVQSADAQGKKGGGGGSAPAFQVVELSTQDGVVNDLNDAVNGTVELVGTMGNQCLYWNVYRNGGAAVVSSRILPALTEGFEPYAYKINNQGLIVGYEANADFTMVTPLVWLSGYADAPISLPVPESEEVDIEGNPLQWSIETTMATSISDDGLIAGFMFRQPTSGSENGEDDRLYAVVWKYAILDGIFTVQDSLSFETGDWYNPELSPLGGYLAYVDRPTVDGNRRAIREQIEWDAENESLGFIPGSWEQVVPGDAYTSDVSSRGIVIGRQSVRDADGHYGFAIDADGTRLKIPGLPSFKLYGTQYHYKVYGVRAINSQNEVLSYQWGQTASGSLAGHRDVISTLGGTSAIDLLSYTEWWVPSSARAMNNDGWVSGRVFAQDISIRRPALIIR